MGNEASLQYTVWAIYFIPSDKIVFATIFHWIEHMLSGGLFFLVWCGVFFVLFSNTLDLASSKSILIPG